MHSFEDGDGCIGQLSHSLIAGRYHLLFQHVPNESVIRDLQAEDYEVLNASKHAGNSTKTTGRREIAFAAVFDARAGQHQHPGQCGTLDARI